MKLSQPTGSCFMAQCQAKLISMQILWHMQQQAGCRHNRGAERSQFQSSRQPINCQSVPEQDKAHLIDSITDGKCFFKMLFFADEWRLDFVFWTVSWIEIITYISDLHKNVHLIR